MEYSFKNHLGEKILCALEKNDSKTLAIMAHGFRGSKEYPLFKEIEKSLKKIGIDSLRIDFSGCGESEGDFSESTIKKQAKEICIAINKLKYEKIILIGQSMGCASSLIASGMNKKVSAMILINPLVFPHVTFQDSLIKFSPYVFLKKLRIEKSLLAKKNKKIKKFLKEEIVGKDMLEEIKTLDLICLAKKTGIPALIIHGKFDELIPVSHAQYLNNILLQSDLEVLNYPHNPLRKKSVKEVALHSIKFIKKLKEKFLK
ncbi:MAG: alpha/beta hydrolase [Candidatus Nanoarchaeia archaeon]|nr:alpha/beta hydrolase [Candidatus Nanoarchaeia archaeon]MDD5499682.1 alpha/beta hydrolase [Candidatus Nanoarchaeia archaeon]